MNIYDIANRLAEMEEGEDVTFGIQVTVKASLSIEGSNNPTAGISATLFFKNGNDEVVYSADLKKNRYMKVPVPPGSPGLYGLKYEDLPLQLFDLLEVLGIDSEDESWDESGHGQFLEEIRQRDLRDEPD